MTQDLRSPDARDAGRPPVQVPTPVVEIRAGAGQRVRLGRRGHRRGRSCSRCSASRAAWRCWSVPAGAAASGCRLTEPVAAAPRLAPTEGRRHRRRPFPVRGRRAQRRRRLRALRPFARSFFIVSTSTFSGAWPFAPGPSKRAGSFSKAGSDRKAAQPARADLALARHGVAVAVRAERCLRVVHVQAAQAADADGLLEVLDHLADLLRRRDVEAGREHVARVEAHAEALVAAGQVDQLAQLLEGAADRVAGAGGVLEQQAAPLRLGERVPRPSRPRARSASSCGSPTVEPGWSTTPSALISSPIRSAWISESADFFRISRSFVAGLIR